MERNKAPSIILKTCRGWSDLNGTIYGSATSLRKTDFAKSPFWFSSNTSRNDTVVPSWRTNLILGCKLFASFNIWLMTSNDWFEMKKMSLMYLWILTNNSNIG